MLGSRKLHICPKVTKMGSIIGHRIDYNGVAKINPSNPQDIYPQDEKIFFFRKCYLLSFC